MESPSEKALDVAKDSERKARATPRKALGREDFGPKSFLTAFRTTMVDPTWWTSRTLQRMTSAMLRALQHAQASSSWTHHRKKSSWSARKFALKTKAKLRQMRKSTRPWTSPRWPLRTTTSTTLCAARGSVDFLLILEPPVVLWEPRLSESWWMRSRRTTTTRSHGALRQHLSLASLVRAIQLLLASACPSTSTTKLQRATLLTWLVAKALCARRCYQTPPWDRCALPSSPSGTRMAMVYWCAHQMANDWITLMPIWWSCAFSSQKAATTSSPSTSRATTSSVMRTRSTSRRCSRETLSPLKRQHWSRLETTTTAPMTFSIPTRTRFLATTKTSCSSSLKRLQLATRSTMDFEWIQSPMDFPMDFEETLNKLPAMSSRSRSSWERTTTSTTMSPQQSMQATSFQDIWKMANFATCRRCTEPSQRSSTPRPRRSRSRPTMPGLGLTSTRVRPFTSGNGVLVQDAWVCWHYFQDFACSSPSTTGTAGILDCLSTSESFTKWRWTLVSLTCCSTAQHVAPGQYPQPNETWTRRSVNELLKCPLWDSLRRSSRSGQRRRKETSLNSPGPVLFGDNLKICLGNDSEQTNVDSELKMKKAIRSWNQQVSNAISIYATV